MPTYQIVRVDPIELIRYVYNHSIPQGLGRLHYSPAELTVTECLDLIVDGVRIDLDYVKGRCCKFHASIDAEKGVDVCLSDWYDHSQEELRELHHWIVDNQLHEFEWKIAYSRLLILKYHLRIEREATTPEKDKL
jgi:hypothetical protein